MSANDASPRDFAWSVYQHSDNLQHQRHYNFATTEAFLFVAAGVGLRDAALSSFVSLVAVVGFVLSIVWWLAMVRLERPQKAILMQFQGDPVYSPYEQPLWRTPGGCLLINDFPPTLVSIVWVSVFFGSVGWPRFRGLWVLVVFPLSLLVAWLVHRLESKARERFLSNANRARTVAGESSGEVPMQLTHDSRSALSRAAFFLDKAEACSAEERVAFEAYLEAAIVFGRAVLHRFQAKHKTHPAWQNWWNGLLSNPSINFIRTERDWLLKEAPPKINQNCLRRHPQS